VGYVYGYTRVSTNKQDLTGQLALCRAAGVPERNTFFDTFTGSDMDRPNFRKLDALLRAGDTVWVPNFWRVGRCDKVAEWLIGLYRDRGVNWIVEDAKWLSPSNTDMPAEFRNAIVWLLSYTGRQYLEGVSFGTKAGMRALAATQGMKPGRMPIASETAALIREYYDQGWTKSKICRVLNVGRTTVFKYTSDRDYNPAPCRKADTTLARLATNGKLIGNDTSKVHVDRRRSRYHVNGKANGKTGSQAVEPFPIIEYAF